MGHFLRTYDQARTRNLEIEVGEDVVRKKAKLCLHSRLFLPLAKRIGQLPIDFPFESRTIASALTLITIYTADHIGMTVPRRALNLARGRPAHAPRQTRSLEAWCTYVDRPAINSWMPPDLDCSKLPHPDLKEYLHQATPSYSHLVISFLSLASAVGLYCAAHTIPSDCMHVLS